MLHFSELIFCFYVGECLAYSYRILSSFSISDAPKKVLQLKFFWSFPQSNIILDSGRQHILFKFFSLGVKILSTFLLADFAKK